MQSIASVRHLAASSVSLASRALRSTRSGRLLILIYHRVRPTRDPMFEGEVDASVFDWQMDLLRRHCSPIAMTHAVVALENARLPERSVAVTFDDGYADNAEAALPLLRKHGIPATFFVAPGFLDGGRMWNDSIIEAVRRAQGPHLDLRAFQQGLVALGPESTRGPVAEAIISAVKRLTPTERGDRVRALCDQIGAVLPNDLMMTSAQVRALARAGMEIGAHTLTHPILRTLSATTVREEIDGSRAALERITGQPVRAFAYPNGRPGEDYTKRDRDMVEAMGFDWAVSTMRGAASRESDVYQLPRFTPWDNVRSKWLLRLLLEFTNVKGP